MSLLYDHLIASILGIAVFFILVVVHQRSGETTRDQTQYYSAKTHLVRVTEMIEHDFANLGAGVAPNDSIFITKDEETFAFMALVDPEDEETSKITYRRVVADVVEIAGEAVQQYEIHRLIDDVLTGKSPATLRAFDVELWDNDHQITTNYTDVAAVHVRFEVASLLGGDDELHVARWNRTFRPANLAN